MIEDGSVRKASRMRVLSDRAGVLRGPKNARRLLESLDQALAGKRKEHELHR